MKQSLLGSLEQKIMDILWQSEKPMKPQEVLSKLGKDYAYTTIMTVMKRMADKKILTRKLCGKVYFYFPVCKKETFLKNNLSSIFGNLMSSYGELAIAQFVDEVKQNKEDLDLLKQYLEDKA